MAVTSTSLANQDKKKTAQDWVRQLRFSNNVNRQTLGVDTDHVTPELMLAASNKLLGISRGQQQGDQKDALQFQRIYGPVQYFAQRIQKDGGSVARSMLWKATNKGNVDFIGSGSLQPHINAVFNQTNLSQFVDNSTPLQGIDASQKVTRIGEGGISSQDSAPIQMRLVQPSYAGYVDPVRTAEKCYLPDTQVMTNAGWKCITDLTMGDYLAVLIDGKPSWSAPLMLQRYDHDGLIYCYDDGCISFAVTPGHRMYVSEGQSFEIKDIDFVFGSSVSVLRGQDVNYVAHRYTLDIAGYSTIQYTGKVYCPTVPGGLIYVRRGNAKAGFWCGNSPGITGYLTKNVLKGTDGKLYQKLYNVKTGQEELVDSQTAATKTVTTNEYMGTPDKYVYAIGGSKGVKIVPRSSVDYILPRADDLFSGNSNLVPMLSGIKAMRLLMGCHHPQTPIVVLDKNGYTDIIPAKRTGHIGDAFLFGCDSKGKDAIYPLRNVVTRVPQKNSKFKTVVLESGRYLPTSKQHKWYIYDGQSFKLVYAKDLKPGMLVPRSMFTSLPVRTTEVMGVPVTKQICVLMGRLIRSLTSAQYNYKFTFLQDASKGVFQKADIEKALKQLQVKQCNIFRTKGVYAVTIKDPVFIDWIEQNIGCSKETIRVPKEILSLPSGFTCAFLDSFYKDMIGIGEDGNEDTWILDLPNDFMRDAMSLMLSKIYTDTQYKDAYKRLMNRKALKLVPMKTGFGDVILEKIVKVYDSQAPAVMIDIDCDDNVYAAGNGIITHNSKYGNQAVPLQQREAPLVRSLDQATGMDTPTILGKLLGTQWAPKSGMVKAVREDRIDMLYDDGTEGSVPLYKDFPANAKGWLTNYPKVKAGDKVDKGALLATSNYTDDKGVLAMGRNLRVAYMSFHGGTYEDACVLSESAAKKMGYTTMYKTDMQKDKSIRTAKTLYKTWKPGQFSKQQFDNLDDQGVVKPGAVLHHGDPVILGIRTTEPSPGTLGKRILTDVTETWEHANPGVVTDVINTKNGIKVFAKVSSPLKVGDKISGFEGNKGTVAQIIPDDEMPQDSKGNPIQLLFDPLGIVSRTNPSQLMQAGLGKVAAKLGHPIIVPQFQKKGESRLQYVKKLMKDNNVPYKENVYDPNTGRTVSNVFVGRAYFMPLKHIADTKMSARGTSTYTAQEIPASGGQQGSKRLGGLESAALVGHNAFDFLKEAKLIRGQSNADFWRSIRTGQIPVMPGEPLVHKKFFATLQASGVNIQRNKQGVSIFALTNKDVDEMAKGRQLKSTDTYQQKNFRPIAGGLFGTDIFGDQGTNWGYIQLDKPLPNPVMQEPLARLLRISDQDFQAVIRGQKEVNGIHNSSQMKAALSKLDLEKEANTALKQLKQASPSRRDAALKRYVAIGKMRDNGVHPQQYMLDRIPVLPPVFRPISSHGGLTMVADSNYLYAQLLNARDDAREAKNLPEQYQQKAQSNIYDKWKQLVGLYDPRDVKLRNKNVKGLLKWALGKSSKWSAFQRKVLGSTVDTVGRGVVVPNTKIKLNEIGMPVQMAWNVYAPFVTRKLVQQGYSPVDAMKLVKEHSNIAKPALVEAVNERPVVMNRAPSLHKLSLMGFNVRLTDGHAIKTNPSIVSPFGMDYDGDTCKALISTELQLSNSCFGPCEFTQNTQKLDLKFSPSLVYYRKKQKNAEPYKKKGEEVFKKNTKVELVNGMMTFQDMEVVPGTEVKKSDTVTEWDVPPIYHVSTIDPETGDYVLAHITKVSKHTNLEMVDVKFNISGSYDHMATVSTDHSLITYNPITLKLEKTKPAEAVGRCVPQTRRNIINGMEGQNGAYATKVTFPVAGKLSLSYNLGMFFGLMIGDGWVEATTTNHNCRIACCEPSLQQNIIKLSKEENMPFTKEAKLFSYEAGEGRFSQSNAQRLTMYLDSKDSEFLLKLIGHGAENKKIPYVTFLGSKTHMLGVLMGLLATDGTVNHNPPTGAKKSPVKSIAYHTVSPELRDGIQMMMHRLGVKTSVNIYTGTYSKNTTYQVLFSLEDMTRLYDEHPTLFKIPVDYNQAAMERIVEDIHNNNKADSKKSVNSYDIVPFPRGLFCEFSWAKIQDIQKYTVISAREKGYIKRSVAKRIAEALERRDWTAYREPVYLKTEDRTNHSPEQAKELIDKWIKLVRDDRIGWEVVDSVTPSTCTEGWDCTVPGPYTFTLSTGTVVQDTVNLHVPVSKAAINDVRQKMMPERNLISMRKNKILYMPQKAYTQGLYVATRMDQKDQVHTFNNLKEAKEAYHKGQINVDTPIVIKET